MNAFATNPDLASDNFLPTDKNYRMTGEMPVEKEETDEEILAQQESEVETSEPSDLATESGKDADLPAAPAQRKGKTKEDTRREFEKLTTHNRELKARLDALEAAQKTPTEAKPTAPPPVTASKKPQMSDYGTMGEYLTAQEAWNDTSTENRVKSILAEQRSQWEAEQAKAAIAKAWNDKAEPVRQKYPDFDEVVGGSTAPMPERSAADQFILDSPVGAEIAYHLHQNPDILHSWYKTEGFDPTTGKITGWSNKVDPLKQVRELMALEQKFSATDTPSVPAVTKAPRPPNQVSGKGTVSASATEKAVEDGDFEAYQKAENAKALARLNKRK